jgi:hypothetical protein
MSGNAVLLSIVVPTRDRTEYAANLIRSLHASASTDFELVVRENSSRPELGGLIAALGDARIRYDYSAEDLNMHQNFDQAIALAAGSYVCALGDDDGILIDQALDVLARARAEGVDAVLAQTLIYNWPGLRHRFWGDVGGTMAGEMFREKSERVLDPAKERDRVFESGVTEGLGLLPRVYQGFVSRRSLDALRQRCGTCFPAASPDMANGVGLVPFVNRLLYTPQPVVISGHSPKSGGGAGAAGSHHGRLEDRTNLPPGTLQTWDPSVPRFWSGVTIYAQSAISAAMASETAPPIPLAHHRLYAACLIYEPRIYWPDVVKAACAAPGSGPLLGVRVAYAVVQTLAKRAITFLTNILNVGLAKRGKRHDTLADASTAFSTGRS